MIFFFFFAVDAVFLFKFRAQPVVSEKLLMVNSYLDHLVVIDVLLGVRLQQEEIGSTVCKKLLVL